MALRSAGPAIGPAETRGLELRLRAPEGAAVDLYLDGQAVCGISGAYASLYWGAGGQWTIGPVLYVQDSIIDDVRVANVKRPASWVRQVYKSGTGQGDLP